MTIPYEELFVFLLLLLGVVGVYYLLKLHYIFAFGLIKNTSLSQKKKQNIEKIKKYIFLVLKVLLWLGLMIVLIFAGQMLAEGESLKAFVILWWSKIPEGFWMDLLFTLLRIALLIVIFRYVLKKIFSFLERQQQKTIEKKVYNKANIEKVYLRFHNTIKYTFVLGVVYRITHFFPFLSEVSKIMFDFLVLFLILACIVTIREIVMMYQTKNKSQR